jgi:hypothetical protein
MAEICATIVVNHAAAIVENVVEGCGKFTSVFALVSMRKMDTIVVVVVTLVVNVTSCMCIHYMTFLLLL